MKRRTMSKLERKTLSVYNNCKRLKIVVCPTWNTAFQKQRESIFDRMKTVRGHNEKSITLPWTVKIKLIMAVLSACDRWKKLTKYRIEIPSDAQENGKKF